MSSDDSQAHASLHLKLGSSELWRSITSSMRRLEPPPTSSATRGWSSR
jgi:hypothetical protein